MGNLVNFGAGEPDCEVDIVDAVVFANRCSHVHNIDPIVLISDKIKVLKLILNDVASLIARPFFFCDDDIIGFK